VQKAKKEEEEEEEEEEDRERGDACIVPFLVLYKPRKRKETNQSIKIPHLDFVVRSLISLYR
jgi:hypothetical protein